MGVQENSILCHGVLDKELLEIPESKICDFRHFLFRSHKNIAGLEVAMHHGTPHVVKACDSLTIQWLIIVVFVGQLSLNQKLTKASIFAEQRP